MTYQPGGSDEARYRKRERQIMIGAAILAGLGIAFLVLRGVGLV